MTVLLVFAMLLNGVLIGVLGMGSLVLTIIAFHAGIFTGIGVLLGCLFVVALYITAIGNLAQRYHLL